jgi:hypothetical protein
MTSANEHEASASEAQEALHTLLHQSSELYAYFWHYIKAQIDLLKLSGRNLFVLAVIAGLGAVLAVSALVVSVVLLLTGLAVGVGVAVGGALWLGQVIVGLAMLILFVIAVLIGWSRIRNRSLSQKVQDYAERQHQQHLQFGHNAADRARHSTV